jgi:putative transposase
MNLAKACQALGVSRSGYHAHLRKHEPPRRCQDAQLAIEIRAAFTASCSTYGSPRLMHALCSKGLRHGNNRIARLMREQHLRVRQKGRFVPRTTVADKTATAAPNHLLQRPVLKRLNEVWITDITYLPTREGWLYLAVEMDLCSRRILGWSTREDLATELPHAALDRALQKRASKQTGLLHHSGRGCQLPHCVRPAGSLRLALSASLRLTTAEFRQRLKLRGITASMSRTANCYDSATMESFWATLKAECFGSSIPATRAQAHSMAFDCIETFYNSVRLHSALGFQSPLAFENAIQNNQPNFPCPRFRRKISPCFGRGGQLGASPNPFDSLLGASRRDAGD